MPKTVRRTDSLRQAIDRARKKGKTIGFVPTMGYLHAGHLALVEECRRLCDLVVVSIFVNPKQFGPDEDLDRYPRDLRRDRRLLAEYGCDIIYVPAVRDVYPPGFTTVVGVEGLRDKLCGMMRPGHFDGVCLVVLKLLLVAAPDMAFFGEKDYQQLVIIRRMVEDLGLPVDIRAVPIARDRDGLALSSRNSYLSRSERATATSLFRSIELARLLVAGGERRAQLIEKRVTQLLLDAGVSKVDYAAVVDPFTLEKVRYIDSEVRIAIAAWVGNTRLIDNLSVTAGAVGRGRTSLRRGTVGVILAAGESKRMKSDLPKVLHPIGGKPMVQHVIEAAREAGIKELLAIVGHRSEKVRPLMKKLGIDAVSQDVPRGTGHAVLQAFPRLARFVGNIVVLSGDTPLVRAQTISRIVGTHSKHANAITFATTVVPDAKGYGRIVRDEDGSFARIVEEKDAERKTKTINEINAGLYCFKAQPLFDALLTVTADNVQMEYYLTDALEAIKSRGGRVEAVVVDDHAEMLGVNTVSELQVIRRLYSRRARDEDNQRGLEDGVHRKRRRR
jgi:pantoate--beta-alanine ligase